MSEHFQIFAPAVARRYKELSKHELLVADTTDLFEAYLASFPEGTNPMMRERTLHDCNCCKSFIRRVGNVVAIVDGEVKTVWDGMDSMPYPYNEVAARLDAIVRQVPIRTVFRTSESRFGIESNYDRETERRWVHFHCEVDRKHKSSQPDTDRSRLEQTAQVLRRGLDELTPEAFETVIDLIDTPGALYRGSEMRKKVTGFQKLLRDYRAADNKTAFVWANLDSPYARVRNEAIGTLLIDLSNGVDVEVAARKFDSVMAPANYRRPTAIITPKMVDSALGTLRDLGLEEAVERRHARPEDVSVNNVLFANRAVASRMKDSPLRAALMEETQKGPVEVKNASPISVDEFMTTILPQAETIEMLVENRHQGNFMSVTAPVHESTGRLFLWDNDFAWSYDGEVADSIKQRVKAAGGKVDARLRASLAWFNTDDLDLHCYGPAGEHIGYHCKGKPQRSGGTLDVDMNIAGDRRDAVENIRWAGRVPDGDYRVVINNFTRRESIDVGFNLEIEFEGAVSQFSYPKALGHKEDVHAVTLVMRNDRLQEIKVANRLLTGHAISSEKWGITTEQLVPVDMIMLSPNYWDDQNGRGNKHWFFILKSAKNPDPVRSFYNEFLRSDLNQHRKVFEVLGSKAKAPYSDEQLSGLGFSSTRQDTVTVVVKGPNIRRAFEIKF